METERYYFVAEGIEIEVQPDHPMRVEGLGSKPHYPAESFYGGTEIECYLDGKWVKGVLDTDTSKAYNKLRHLELIRSVQGMNRPKLYVVR